MSNFEYEFINDEDKIALVTQQIKDLETQHFAMSMVEPSKLNQSDQHVQWRSNMLALENLIVKTKDKLKDFKFDALIKEEDE